MVDLPKLKIKRSWDPTEEIRDLKQAKYSLFAHGPDMLILVEGQCIGSYEELVHLASQEDYKDS